MTSGMVLLSGASGMLGGAIRDALQASGSETIQLVRGRRTEAGQVLWDPGAARPVDTGALQAVTAAIHLSGANVAAHRWTPAYKRSMIESRVDSTRAIALTLAHLPKPPRVLLIASATGIYGDRGDELLDESSAPGTGFLADLCQAWEQAAAPAVAAGVRVVHLRFGVVLGGGAGALGRMLPAFRLGLGGRLGNGRQWMSWIALEDVVGAVRFLLEAPEITGAVNVTSPNPVRNAEFTRSLAQQLRRPAIFAVPAWTLRLAFGQMAEEALLSSAKVLPQKLVNAGFQFTKPRIFDALATI